LSLAGPSRVAGTVNPAAGRGPGSQPRG
jgi:hypothetical protein